MDLNTIKNMSTWGSSAAHLNENFSKIKVEIEKLKYISESPFIGYYNSADNLPAQTSPAWALVGDLPTAKPYAYYLAGNVPSGYTSGWNDLSGILGTYDFTDLSNLLQKLGYSSNNDSKINLAVSNQDCKIDIATGEIINYSDWSVSSEFEMKRGNVYRIYTKNYLMYPTVFYKKIGSKYFSVKNMPTTIPAGFGYFFLADSDCTGVVCLLTGDITDNVVLVEKFESFNDIQKYNNTVNNSFVFNLNSPIFFSTAGGKTKAKILESFHIFSLIGLTSYIIVPPQEIEVPDSYGCIVAVYDKVCNRISTNLMALPINKISSAEEGKIYIPIMAYTYLSKSNPNSLLYTFDHDKCNNRIINYSPSWDNYTNTLAGGTALYGTFIPIKCKILGFYCRINSIDSDIIVYRFNIKTNVYSIIKTFSKNDLNTGISYLPFDSPELIGEDEQLMISGKIGYYLDANSYSERTLNFYTNNPSKVSVNYTALRLAICYKLDFDMDLTEVISKLPVSETKIERVNTVMGIDVYNSTLDNVGYVGRYVPIPSSVKQVILNVREDNTEIKIALINIENQTFTPVKTVTVADKGVTAIDLDSPVEIGYNKQIVVHGKIGYIYSTSIKNNLSGNQITYNYSGNGIIQISPISLVDFSVSYVLENPILLEDYINRNIDNIWEKLINAESQQPGSSETITINVSDYNNNLRSAFAAIIPSESKHYTILIPEGTYNVDSWFTDEEKAVESNSFRGLELPNYVKLLGVGAREKIILQWINSSSTNRGFISVLNTHEWHELENLTVIGENIRYAVHDDVWNGLSRYLRVTDCEFKVTDCSRAWGAGHNGRYDGEFVDCKFSVYKKRGNMDAMTYIEPFCLHDNTYSKDDSRVSLVNCRFYNVYTDHPCVNFGMSESTGITHARIIGCKMNTNVFLGAGSEGTINCRVTGYGNIMGTSPAISENAVESIETLIDII